MNASNHSYEFWTDEWMDRRTERRTDQRTDRPYCRDAWMDASKNYRRLNHNHIFICELCLFPIGGVALPQMVPLFRQLSLLGFQHSFGSQRSLSGGQYNQSYQLSSQLTQQQQQQLLISFASPPSLTFSFHCGSLQDWKASSHQQFK